MSIEDTTSKLEDRLLRLGFSKSKRDFNAKKSERRANNFSMYNQSSLLRNNLLNSGVKATKIVDSQISTRRNQSMINFYKAPIDRNSQSRSKSPS